MLNTFENNNNIITNIIRIQACDSTCGYFCTGLIDFMFKRANSDRFYKYIHATQFQKD